MQTTVRIDDATFREAKAEAARLGITLSRFLEEALRQKIAAGRNSIKDPDLRAEIEQRNRLMEDLLQRTAHFRVGPHPSREEMNAR
jgi:hypothetical protein